MTPDFKDVALIIKLVEEKSAGYEMKVENALTTIYQRGQKEVAEDAIKMADALELECGMDGDKGTKQWMAFKGFRTTLRDKYISK